MFMDNEAVNHLREQLIRLRKCTDIDLNFTDVRLSIDNVLDHFTLIIAYCGKALKWDVIFCCGNPAFPPDFVFPDGEETFTTLDRVQSLKSYDVRDATSLLSVVKELVQLYKEYQSRLVSNYPNERLRFEYDAIQHSPVSSQASSGVEFLVEQTDQPEVRCMIPLGIDLIDELGLDGLDVKPEGNSAEDIELHRLYSRLKLMVLFKPESVFKTPEIRLLVPFQYDKALNKLPKLPSWTTSTYLLDFVPQVKEIVQSYVESLKLRRNLILSFIEEFGSPLEYDHVHYSRVSFVFFDGPFPAVAHFTIPDKYPDALPPPILLQAPFIWKAGRIFQLVRESYPYSPRWPPEELARRIKTYLVELDWKKICQEEASKAEK